MGVTISQRDKFVVNRKGKILYPGSTGNLIVGALLALALVIGEDFLIIKMNDVIITGVVQSAPSSEAGSETVSLEFAKVDWEFKPEGAGGSLDPGIHFKFDIKANKVG